jgi:porin
MTRGALSFRTAADFLRFGIVVLLFSAAVHAADDPLFVEPEELVEPAVESTHTHVPTPDALARGAVAGVELPAGLLPDPLHGGHGITFEYVYTGEVFSNTRGGITTRNATQYEGLLDLALVADFREAGLPLPGRFFMLAQNTHGRGLTEDFIGDAQVISNIDSFDNIMQVSEYWWEIPLLDGDLIFVFGKQDLNTDFGVTELAVDFVQSSFGLTPSVAVPTYPAPSFAAVVKAQLTEILELKVGIWDGRPKGGNWGFSGSGVTLTVGELKMRYELGRDNLPGDFYIGAAYHADDFFHTARMSDSSGDYISYLGIDQMLWRECHAAEETDQGFGVFGQYSWTPPQINEQHQYAGAGVIYHGLFSGRDNDTMGAGVAHLIFNDSPGQSTETVVEWFYKAEITPEIMLQPDVQFIATPSGVHRDALVLGLRFEVVL